MAGRPRRRSVAPTVFPIPLPEIEACLLEYGAWEGDVLHHCRGGTALTMSMRKVLRRSEDGGPPVVMESVADVTALREAEGKLRALNQHLEARVRAEVEAREAAQVRAAQAERVQALGQLAGGIAHDFNNVLQAVTGGAAVIERRAGDPEKVRQLSRMVLDAAQRGASVTRRLLVFARRGDLRTEALDATALLQGMREILQATLGGRVKVEMEAEPALPPLLADQGQLETVLVNLAANARDAMSEQGTLTLSARAETFASSGHGGRLVPGGYIALTVADTGTGMDAATLARATEPFFTTKGPGKGTGLGLAMARGFAEQSKGSLQIVSTPGEGTAITLWLPAAHEQFAVGKPDMIQTIEAAPCTARVLLVDDDDSVRESLAAGLTDMGFRVRTATSGEAALALIHEGEPVDCLVTDLSMLGMNGVSLVHAARGRHPGLPAIVLTGYAGHEALADGDVTEPSYALLWKPTDPARIARRIAELLSGEAELTGILEPDIQVQEAL
jgi:signal transduction histidine kinase/ActR/RegA family two-component response regulator